MTSVQVGRRGFLGSGAAALAGTLVLSGSAACAQAPAARPTPGEPTDPRIEALLAKMSLADKIAQLNMPQVLPDGLVPKTSPVTTDEHRKAYAAGKWRDLGQGGGFFGFFNETIAGALPVKQPRTPRQQAEAANELQKVAEGSKLGIPLLQIAEGTNGHSAPYATIFPAGPSIAATWNTGLVGAVYGAVAAEARACGTHVLNTLVAEVFRDPRFGRGCEGYGEDPYLVGGVIGAIVRAVQGTDVSRSDRTVASLCHFPLQTPNVGGLEGSSVEIGERELRAIHLPSWRAGFADAGALMTLACQSTIDGVPTHRSEKLLTQVLRGELGFRGVVISEGGGLTTLVTERVAADQKQAGAQAIKAGVDVGITWEDAYLDGLKDGVKDGSVPMELVDRAVRRVLMLKLRLGLFDNPYVDPARAEQIVGGAAHRALALQAAREGITLLKNDGGLLPIKSSIKRIAVIGPNADVPENLTGDYAPWPPKNGMPTVLASIKAAAPAGTRVTYAKGCGVNDADRTGFAKAVATARGADLVVLVLGERSKGFLFEGATGGEGVDAADLNLTGVQDALVQAVHATGKPVVIVLVAGRPLAITWPAEHVPAIVQAWLPGERGGEAIADVLFGKCDPGGRLPVTVPRSVGQLPIYNDVKPMRAAADGYVGLKASPLYEFGHGLSYTTFRYDNLKISRRRIKTGETTEVRVDVTNTGHRTGQEVVQLYLADQQSSVSLPVKQLRGFAKVELKPGQKRTVRLTLGPREMELVDESMRQVVEPGAFEVQVGSSSARIHLRGTFEVVAR
ncbi:glycoside hydrolase family 3 N-terminal domain-containing protein [Actinoallomurus acanthiterrae]